MSSLTNFQINQLFVILTTFFGLSAVLLTIIILCRMWCYSCGRDISLIDPACHCSSHHGHDSISQVPDSIEFARGVKMSSTLRTDSSRAPNSDPLQQFSTQSYIKMSDIDSTIPGTL